jgi:biotin carboxylase
MSKYIYFVGKPYPYLGELDVAGNKEYKFGLFLDKNSRIRNREPYDDIIEVDFSSPKAMFASLAGKDLQVDALVCTYENYIAAKSRLAEHFNAAAPSIASAEMSTDKYLMRRAFRDAEPLISPGFGLVSSEADALELAKQLGYPLILKPANLVKSLLVLRCNNEAELLHNFAYAKDRIAGLYKKYRVYGHQPQIILEKYIEGRTCSIAAFVDKHGTPHFCEGIVALTNAQDKAIDDNYIYERRLPAEFDEKLQARLFEAALQGIAALDMTSTPAHVELIYNDREVKIIEIGARIGGYRPRMYSLSYGLDLITQEIKLALGQTPDLAGKFQAFSAVYELFPEKEGIFDGISGEADTSRFTRYALKAKPGKTVGPAKRGYKAVAVIIISSKDKQEFLKMHESVDQLKVKVK